MGKRYVNRPTADVLYITYDRRYDSMSRELMISTIALMKFMLYVKLTSIASYLNPE